MIVGTYGQYPDPEWEAVEQDLAEESNEMSLSLDSAITSCVTLGSSSLSISFFICKKEIGTWQMYNETMHEQDIIQWLTKSQNTYVYCHSYYRYRH